MIIVKEETEILEEPQEPEVCCETTFPSEVYNDIYDSSPVSLRRQKLNKDGTNRPAKWMGKAQEASILHNELQETKEY